MPEGNSVIIVGAGHNGLVAAGYLARAGVNVTVLERRHVVGGAAVTEEIFPGYHFSTCAYSCHALQVKIIDDLELRRHGFHLYRTERGATFLFPNGRSLRSWRDDDEKNAKEVHKICPDDVEGLHKWDAFMESARTLVNHFYLRPPPTLAELSQKAKEMDAEDVLESLLTVPMMDLAKRFFKSEEMRTVVCHQQDLGDLTAPGSALMYAMFGHPPGLPDDPPYSGVVRGGMGGVTQAMARSAEQYGVSIRTNAEVGRILTENGGVTGVELKGGEVLSSDIVVSNADPKRTCLKLLAPEDLDVDFIEDVRALKTNSASLRFLCALRALPDFSEHLGPDYDPKDLRLMRLYPSGPSPDIIQATWENAKSGAVANVPSYDIQIPSMYDSTLAPEGHHVMHLWVYFQPPHLKEGSWADKREEIGTQLIEAVSKYAPNFRDCIVDWTVFTPEDLEERMGLTDGNIRHIDMIPQQLFSRRPLPGWANYRLPIRGLYMCGAGTHPGGEVTGAPGHNAAHVILQDLGLSK